jgi:integrase
MGRNRRSDRHLPAKVYLEHGAYYYRDGKKPRIPLGRDLGEALAKYSALIGNTWSLRTLGDVIDRYRIEVLALKKSEKTRKEEGRSLDRLKIALGHFLPDSVTAVNLYTYMDARKSKDGRPVPIAARHEIVLLGHVYKKAKRWGAASINPVTGIELPEKAGKRPYVPMEQVEMVKKLANPRMRLAIDWAVMIGQRRADLLKLKRSDIRKDGIYVQQGKTEAELIMEMSPAVETLIARSDAMSPQIPREYLIRKGNGKPYSGSGFYQNWRRLMLKHAKAGGQWFTFHDLRSVSADEADTIEEARDRLGHASTETTKRFYRRKPTKAKPAS